MPEQSLVSIIIPCYNYALFLPQSVESLQKQTYENWECIIIDDGSTDNSREVAESLAKSDLRIRYYLQSNAGPTVARNLGLSKANGSFIQFLDADDLIEAEKLEKQLALFAKQPECDIVYSGVKYFRSGDLTKLYDDISLEGSRPWMKKLSGKGDVMVEALLRENLMVIHSPLFRASLVERFGKMDEELYYNEDWELWARFAINGACFLFDESPGTQALVRVHESYSKDNFKMFVYGLSACLKLGSLLKDKKFKRIMVPKIAYHKRIIDEKLIALLRHDKKAAVEKSLLVEKLTGIKRYKLYTKMFNSYPVWICYLYSRFVFIIHKLKNVIVYA
ncbi:MAG TPA: glycosyltransferase family 2 protein [Bacteroidia bacterium]|jgi:glycosyltransferase involved in cell wall biosynthesis